MQTIKSIHNPHLEVLSPGTFLNVRCLQCSNTFNIKKWSFTHIHLPCRYCASKSKIKTSKQETEFLDYLEKNFDFVLDRQKVFNCEFEGEKKSFYVDAFDHKNNIVYEYLGCFYHSCPQCMELKRIDPSGSSPYIGKTNLENYIFTKKRLDTIEKQCGEIRYIWEHSWKKFKEDIITSPELNVLLYCNEKWIELLDPERND